SAAAAMRTARRGHDELTKLLWPNIIRRTPALASRPPFTLEERMASKAWIVGTPEQARDTLCEMHAGLGVEALVIFPHRPGMRRQVPLEQLGRFRAAARPWHASCFLSPRRHRREGDTPKHGQAEAVSYDTCDSPGRAYGKETACERSTWCCTGGGSCG